jgi:hypothetical protein
VRRAIWAYGGGKQTIAILTLIAEGKLPAPELAIFADTSMERTSTHEYLDEIAKPLMARLGIRFEVASHELATVDLYAYGGVLYEVVWWRDGTRHSAWVSAQEFSSEKPKVGIGFRPGGNS